MRLLRSFLAAVALAVLPLAAGADDASMEHKGMGRVGEIQVSGAWVRTHLPKRPTAGYLMVQNAGDTADRLIAVKSPGFETIELHESRMEDGVMKMEPIPGIEIGAGGMAMLEPGGKHLMMFGGEGLKEGDSVSITLVFETAGEVTLDVPVRRRGPEHSGHGHGAGHGGKARE